jgi:hypothetical protein
VGEKPNNEVMDANLMMQVRDPQMKSVVEEVLKLQENHPQRMTPAPLLGSNGFIDY